MDDTNQRYAYRCLPLNIANAYGWEILASHTATAVWNGGDLKEDISIQSSGHQHDGPVSHFGHGVLTYPVRALFRTEPNVNLFATGPINSPKDGIYALTGIIETDWSPYSFTMNWKFTRPNYPVTFEKGEPICALFPVEPGLVETTEPEMRSLSENAELCSMHRQWSDSRKNFNKDLHDPESDAVKQKWQKTYFHGDLPSGEKTSHHHRSKFRTKEFKSTE